MVLDSYPILNEIENGKPLTGLSEEQLEPLCRELRSCILETILQNGGHLASSLGAVEAIVAAERVFSSSSDRIVFDVGHQAYAHKLLTGRASRFDTVRTENGISGFPKRQESERDYFGTGHASTSISAILGMARAIHLQGRDGTAVAFIGDSALGGGEALEALNDAGNTELPLVVILNDNDMSISRPHGALRQSLQEMRVNRRYVDMKRKMAARLDNNAFSRLLFRRMKGFKDRVREFLMPNQLFEQFGFVYMGPVDGHDVKKLESIFKKAKDYRKPVIVHIMTVKGKGYLPAEVDPSRFHGIAPAGKAKSGGPSCSKVFGDALISAARKSELVCAVTAAMAQGTGLEEFSKEFPDRFFDVGIAEEHAVTMAAGLAAEGMRPVAAIYSTFLQRAYDQIIHDVCLQKLPVVFAVDRAGLTGEDGETHQGVYDLAYLSTAPGMRIYVPSSTEELQQMLPMALSREEPAAVRYPRGSLPSRIAAPLDGFTWEEILPVSEITVLACGTMVGTALETCKEMGAGLVNARFPFEPDEGILSELHVKAKHVITMEDGILSFGTEMKARLSGTDVITLAVKDEPVAQGTVAQQRARYGLTAENLKLLIGKLEDGNE